MYRDTSGQRSGFFVELAEVIAREIGRPVEYLETGDAKGLIAAQNAGRSQMVAGIVRLPSLVEAHIYSDPVATDQLRYAVLVQNIQAFESAPVVGRRIGIVPSILGSEEPILAENTPVAFTNVEAALFALLTRDVEALLIPPPTIFRLARNVGVDDQVIFGREVVGEIPRHVMLHRSRADLMPAINAAIARLEASGELGSLRQKFSLDVPPPEPAVLRVPIAHAPPYGILSEDGSVTGYAAEIFRDLAARAGLSIHFEPVSLDVYFSAVSSHSFDVIPFVLGSETLSPDLDLTIPIDSAVLTIVVRPEDERFQDWTDLSDARVGSFPDTVGLAQQNGFPAAELRAFDTPEALATALEQGEIDAIMEVGHALSAEGLTDRFRSIGAPDFTVDNVIGLRPGLGAVRERLNAVIPGYLLSDDYALLRRTYFARQVFWTPTRLACSIPIYVAHVLSSPAPLDSTFWVHMLEVLLLGYLAYTFVGFGLRSWRKRLLNERQLMEFTAYLEATNRELEAARLEAEASAQAKSAFLATMSHEIRTPLNAISGMGELLQNRDLDAEADRYVTTIRDASKSLLRIVNDVLDFSRLDAGQLTLEHRPFSPRDALEATKRLMQPLAEEKGLRFGLVLDGSLPAHAISDETRLKQILMNLTSNAIKFTEEGEVNVHASATENEEGWRLRILVSDSGIGIPQDSLEKVFDPFYQGNNASTRRHGGTGLGLSPQRRLTEALPPMQPSAVVRA
ncbi:transporter substrate-binding domain-containing protein [Ferrimonas balearica]|nr:transporter substrate-binding domain-containing protein [Ferrimonas balearica]